MTITPPSGSRPRDCRTRPRHCRTGQPILCADLEAIHGSVPDLLWLSPFVVDEWVRYMSLTVLLIDCPGCVVTSLGLSYAILLSCVVVVVTAAAGVCCFLHLLLVPSTLRPVLIMGSSPHVELLCSSAPTGRRSCSGRSPTRSMA